MTTSMQSQGTVHAGCKGESKGSGTVSVSFRALRPRAETEREPGKMSAAGAAKVKGLLMMKCGNKIQTCTSAVFKGRDDAKHELIALHNVNLPE